MTNDSDRPLMLIDGASLWFRAFHGVPEKITAPDGRPVNALRGFLDMITTLVERENPRRLVVCLDVDWRPQFRVDLIPSYKAHRVVDDSDDVEEVPDTLGPQVMMINRFLAAAGITSGGAVDCEADDVIGTLALGEAHDPVVVVSGDRDLLQLAADTPVPIRVLYVGRGVNRGEMFSPTEVSEKYGVPAHRAGAAYAEMAMLRGDPSDGLPGVSGIGDKTAARLLTAHGTLDAVEAAAAAGDASMSTRIAAAIVQAHDYLRAARTVVIVRDDAAIEYPTGMPNGVLPAEPVDVDDIHAMVAELGIASSANRIAHALGWSHTFSR